MCVCEPSTRIYHLPSPLRPPAGAAPAAEGAAAEAADLACTGGAAAAAQALHADSCRCAALPARIRVLHASAALAGVPQLPTHPHREMVF